MIEMFIRRPVLSLVISLIIVLLGVLAMFKLPVTQFPDIVPPSVSVTANYTGANAEVCANAVAIPLERAINGVPGMTYMTTVTSNNGSTKIQVFFNVGTDPDVAAINVQNRITTVLDELPEEVIKAGVTSEKEINSMLMYLNILSTDTTLDEKFIYNFTDINILKELKRIDGVGLVEIMGLQDYAMRVWLKPDRMHAYNVSTDEVVEAIRKQNIEAAPGKTGESSGQTEQTLQYVIKYTGKFDRPEQYENIVIRADNSGSFLRLKDIADIEFGSLSYAMTSKTNGRPSASIMIKQRPGSNAGDIIKNIKNRMAEIKEASFPAGMTYNISYDVSRFLDASMHEVFKTLFEAFLLVFVIVFLFLQDWRSTIIPALAVPVAMVGTLFFMLIFGFSLNLMTLFALVLSIGIVVDNAIVVVEAVHEKMNSHHLPAFEATVETMKEISGAVIAITLVMAAVFIPVAFMEGPVGIFYRQFSITLAIAIFISGINALTLTPALCAIILRPTHGEHSGSGKGILSRFFKGFNSRYDKLVGRYKGLLLGVTSRRLLIAGALGAFVIATWGVNKILPSGFIPAEDQGMIYVNVTTPAGATLERTEKVLDTLEQIAQSMQSEGIEATSTLAGYNLMNDIAGSCYGMMMINLKPWSERKHVNEIMARLTEKSKVVKDASIQYFAPPTVPGFGNAGGFELRLLNKTASADNITQTAEQTERFMAELNKSKEVTNVVTGFNPYFPQYMVHVDQEVAAKKGVSIDNALGTLKTMLGSYYTSNFIRFGQMYKVMLQAAPGYRTKPEDLLDMYVKNDKGEMVPYSTFIKLERVYGPEQLTRYNMYLSAMINGDASAGYSSGDVIKVVEEKAKKILPRGYAIEWSGITREEVLAGNQVIFIFIICLVFVYLLLAAQYESFLLPHAHITVSADGHIWFLSAT
jgi:HAE1 family hydrophobic/amphiphilic exporter-1